MLVSSVPQLEVKSHISKWCRYESCMEHFFLFSSPLLTLQCVYVTIAFVPAHPGIHWMLLLKYLEQLESTLRELSIFHLWPNTPLVLPNAENDVIVLRSRKLASSMVPTSFPLPHSQPIAYSLVHNVSSFPCNLLRPNYLLSGTQWYFLSWSCLHSPWQTDPITPFWSLGMPPPIALVKDCKLWHFIKKFMMSLNFLFLFCCVPPHCCPEQLLWISCLPFRKLPVLFSLDPNLMPLFWNPYSFSPSWTSST